MSVESCCFKYVAKVVSGLKLTITKSWALFVNWKLRRPPGLKLRPPLTQRPSNPGDENNSELGSLLPVNKTMAANATFEAKKERFLSKEIMVFQNSSLNQYSPYDHPSPQANLPQVAVRPFCLECRSKQ